MLAYLRRRLRDWLRQLLQEDAQPTAAAPSNVLDVIEGGTVYRFVAVGRLGMRLEGSLVTPTGRRTYLIGVEQACDPAAFWEIWRELGGDSVVLTWEEDGEPFQP